MPSSASRRRRRTRKVDPHALFVGLGCLGVAVGLAYLTLGTPLVERLAATGRIGSPPTLTGALIWAIALTGPAALGILGVARLSETVEILFGSGAKGPVRSLGKRLGAANALFGPIRLPDGRLIPELVIGPHGVAIFEVLPPRGASRHHGQSWEVRLPDGHWIPIENPLDQASRDADRVRRWLSNGDRDYVVKVHAAVIAPDDTIPRTPTCAVITREQIPGFLAALPGQRTLTENRLSDLIGLVSAAS